MKRQVYIALKCNKCEFVKYCEKLCEENINKYCFFRKKVYNLELRYVFHFEERFIIGQRRQQAASCMDSAVLTSCHLWDYS